MVFSSIEFIFFFLPIVLLAYYAVPIKLKNVILLIASLLFYGWGEPVYVLLMLCSATVGYIFGIIIEKAEKGRKLALFLAIAINLAVLGFFKYADFIADILGLNRPDIPLPIGISFFTFQIMSYIVDIYRGEVKAQKKLINVLLYISLFPQLIAGPIVKYHDIEKQLENRAVNIDSYCSGMSRFMSGLFKKVLIANRVGLIWEQISSGNVADISLATAWLGATAYTIQIYFDFSGYSDMAIGIGKMLGFDFMENFNYPYISRSIREFWRRWHISLSTWFKEYLYIPLGGNRKGKIRTYINLLIVFFCTGLWHGASWNFVLWGLWHGLFSIIERLGLGKVLDKSKIISHIYTMLIVIIGFAIFAITDADTLRQYLGSMLLDSNGILVDNTFKFMLQNNFVILAAGIIFAMPFTALREKLNKYSAVNALKMLVYIVLFVACIAYLVSSSYNPFLYFRF